MLPCVPLFWSPISSAAADEPIPVIKVQNGKFDPSTLTVASSPSLRLKVINTGETAVEFESFELNRERVVAPGREIVVYLPSLSPGKYQFFDDFHRETGLGTLIVK